MAQQYFSGAVAKGYDSTGASVQLTEEELGRRNNEEYRGQRPTEDQHLHRTLLPVSGGEWAA